MVLPASSDLKQLPLDSQIEKAALIKDKQLQSTKADQFKVNHYKPPAEEDWYVPPGRKPYDRDELNPSENKIDLGPPILQNDQLYRQQYAIQDYMRTLRHTIAMNDLTGKVGPQQAIKPAIKNAFYIKEQRWVNPDFVEPDDELLKDKETGLHVSDYIKSYKENPQYMESDDQTQKAIRQQLGKKFPLPGYARIKIAFSKKIHKLHLEAQQSQSSARRNKRSMTMDASANGGAKVELPIRKPRFKNHPQVTGKIKLDGPVFQRDHKKDVSRDAHLQLHQKLLQSDHVLRQIKNGSTIFDSPAMKTKYSNPYFRNEDMHQKLVNYLEQRKPKQSPNPNINAFEQELLPVPEKSSRSQAPWTKSLTQRLQQWSQTDQSFQTLSPLNRSPFRGPEFISQDDQSASNVRSSAFKFGSPEDPKTQETAQPPHALKSPGGPTTAQESQRPSPSNRMLLSLDIASATQSHYPAIDQKSRNQLGSEVRASKLRNNSVAATEVAHLNVGSNELPQMQQSFLTMQNTPLGGRSIKETKFEKSMFLTQTSVDPSSALPPCNLNERDTAAKIDRELKFPLSPAFVSIYKMNKDIKMKRTQDFCKEKNIPFSSEEHNFYRLKQNQVRFKQYAHTVNKCFETSRPSEFTTGASIMADKRGSPPLDKVTQEFGDARLFVPNVFSQAHQKKIELAKKSQINLKKRASRSQKPAGAKKSNKSGKSGKAPDTYGMLFQALEGAHELSNKNMLQLYREGEQIKQHALNDLQSKLNRQSIISLSKPMKSLNSSAQSLPSQEEQTTSIEKEELKSDTSVPEKVKASPKAKRKVSRAAKKDPIYKILKVHHKSYKFRSHMNDLLVKILERYELDKPILMRDKLDIIWDKPEQQPKEETEASEDSEEEYQRVLKESSMSYQEAQEREIQMQREKIKKAKEKMLRVEDNVNQYAVKFKLGKRKVHRANVNAYQQVVYNKLLETIASRKAKKPTKFQLTQQAYIRPMEVEREFLDAFSVIIESGYYLEQNDFLQLIDMLKVQHQSNQVQERAKIFEFFTLAAELLEYDVELVKQILSEPWMREIEDQSSIITQGFIFKRNLDGVNATTALEDKQMLRQIELNQMSGFLDSGVEEQSAARDPFRDTQLTQFTNVGFSVTGAGQSQTDQLGQSHLSFNPRFTDQRNLGLNKISVHESAED